MIVVYFNTLYLSMLINYKHNWWIFDFPPNDLVISLAISAISSNCDENYTPTPLAAPKATVRLINENAVNMIGFSFQNRSIHVGKENTYHKQPV